MFHPMQIQLFFQSLLHHINNKEHTIMVNDETLLTFNPDSVNSFSYLSETLELDTPKDTRELGLAELALLINVLKEKKSVAQVSYKKKRER